MPSVDPSEPIQPPDGTSGRVIGIDLGTTNSCVAVYQGTGPALIPAPDGSRTTPSVVAFTDDGSPIVGASARRQAILNPERTVMSVKRLMGRRANERPDQLGTLENMVHTRKDWLTVKIGAKHWLPQEISALILTHLKESAEAWLGEKVTGAVITVPAYFNGSQRTATREAGELAGLEVLSIINEPTAAALAYGLDGQDGIVLVFDLGGGTFDVSVLDISDEGRFFEVKATSGDNHLGGDDFDQAIVNHLLDVIKSEHDVDVRSDAKTMQRLYEVAERAKCELSGIEQANIDLPYLAKNPHDADEMIHFVYTLDREQLTQLSLELLERLRAPVLQAMEDAQVTADTLDQVVLVGGMTRMPAVVEMVRSMTHREPVRSINPDEAVALGAALKAHVMSGDVDPLDTRADIVLMDVTPLTLGIEVKGGISKPLIPRTTMIPVTASEVFTTAIDNQASVEIRVVQGERSMAKDNRMLARLTLTDIPLALRGQPQIEVTFEIDADGILELSARDLETGVTKDLRIEGSSALSEGDAQQLIEEAQFHSLQDHQRLERAALRNRAETLAYATQRALRVHREQLPADVRDILGEAIARVQESLALDDNQLQQLSEELLEVGLMLTEALSDIGQGLDAESQALLTGELPDADALGTVDSTPSAVRKTAQVLEAETLDDDYEDDDADFESAIVID